MRIDEKLWETAKILAEEKKTEQAIVVIHSIAAHVVGRYSGKLIDAEYLVTSKRELNVKQLIHLKELSKEVSDLMEKHANNEAQEKAMEYVDEIIRVLASSEKEERELRKKYFKHFIRIGNRPHRYKIKKENKFKTSIHESNHRQTSYGTISSQLMTTYTTSEAAEILNVSDQTIRRMCEASKFPGATRTDGGHWRIPRDHFRITLDESRQVDKDLKAIRKKSAEGEPVDEFDL